MGKTGHPGRSYIFVWPFNCARSVKNSDIVAKWTPPLLLRVKTPLKRRIETMFMAVLPFFGCNLARNTRVTLKQDELPVMRRSTVVTRMNHLTKKRSKETRHCLLAFGSKLEHFVAGLARHTRPESNTVLTWETSPECWPCFSVLVCDFIIP